jgi:hypothetical protein
LFAILRGRQRFQARLDSASIFLFEIIPTLEFLLKLSPFLRLQGLDDGLRRGVNIRISHGR